MISINLRWFCFAIVPCGAILVCPDWGESDSLAELTVESNTQAHAMAAGVGGFASLSTLPPNRVDIWWQRYQVALSNIASKEVSSSTEVETQNALKRAVLSVMDRLAANFANEGIAIAADAATGFVVGAGVTLLWQGLEHWTDQDHLMRAADHTMEGMIVAYRRLVLAFVALPADISQLQNVADEPFLCRWHTATQNMNTRTLDAQHAVQNQQVYYDQCWAFCGTRIPESVTTDLQHVQSNLEDMDTQLGMFATCYPHCSQAIVSSAWSHITDDVYKVCIHMRHACNDLQDPTEQSAQGDYTCSATACQRLNRQGVLMLLEAPTEQSAQDLSALPQYSSSCGHLADLVTSTRGQISDQKSRVSARRQHASTLKTCLLTAAAVVWFFGVMRGFALVSRLVTLVSPGDTDDYHQQVDVDDGGQACSTSLCSTSLQRSLVPGLVALLMMGVGITMVFGWWLDTVHRMIDHSLFWVDAISDDIGVACSSSDFSNLINISHEVSGALISVVQQSWQSTPLKELTAIQIQI